MVSLLDIAPSTETVTVGDHKVNVEGISAEGIAHLLSTFPALKSMLMGKQVKVEPADILEFGPKVVAAIIAAGCGMPGNEEAEARAASLPVGVQVDFIEAILRQTMPGGVGPFMEKLEKLIGKVGVSGDGGKARRTN